MAISRTIKEFLDKQGIAYSVLAHEHSDSSEESARAAHIPLHQMAKAVVLEDDQGYIAGIDPSKNRTEVDWVNEELGRHLQLAHEEELGRLFSDCDFGAVPAMCHAYGVDVIWDEQLQHASDIYFEAGDHEHLVHIRGEDFNQLMASLPRSVISARPDYSRWV